MAASDVQRNFTDGTVTMTDDGGNSETAPLIKSISWDGLVPKGRAAEVYQNQGAFTGKRLGERTFPTVTVECDAPEFGDFFKLAMGEIAGFTSTTAGIGDYPSVDLSIDESYSTSTRVCTFDDCHLTGAPYASGSPGTVSYTFEVNGPVVIDGTTYIAAR